MRTILIIDDDQGCRAPTAEVLRQAKWNVIEASDGEEGLKLAVKHRPDIILCDLLMPRLNGYQVCRQVREHLELRHTRLIVVTGRDYAADRKSAEEAGADGYLVKPIDFDRLNDALGRILPPRTEVNANAAAAPAQPDSGTRVKFWGVRGSIPAPGQSTVFFGGNTSCVEVRAAGQIIILDAGSGIRMLGLSLAKEFSGKVLEMTLLITHTHWDHIQGFPFFVPAYNANNKLLVLGYEGASEGLQATLAGQMESPYFPVRLEQMPGNIVIEEQREMSFQVGAIPVEACFTNHPGVCVGYKLHTPGGKIAYVPDNETVLKSAEASNGGPVTIENNIRDFVAGVDVLIMDAQYTAEEYETHVGWGHGCVDEVVRLAIDAGVRRLYLFHHDPAHDDRQLAGILAHARKLAAEIGSDLHIEAAREGDELRLEAGVAVPAKRA